VIKINLVSKGAPAVAGAEGVVEDLKELQKKGAMNLLIILAGPLALYGYDYVKIPELQSQVRRATTELNKLKEENAKAKSALEEKKKFEEDRVKLQTQIRSIESLSADRIKEVRLLDSIQRDLPQKVWLTRLEIKGDRLNLQGLAISDLDLTSLMEILSQSVFLKDVRLIRSAEQTSPQGVLKTFQVTATLFSDALTATGGL
jgi:type IV pilus assembly protein PilN